MSEQLVYPMSKDAQLGMKILGGLLCVLIVTIPLGVWLFFLAKRGHVLIGADTLTAKRMMSAKIPLASVKRFGTLRVKVAGAGIGGMIAKKMCGGPVAVNVCFQLENGKTKTYMASAFERPDEQINNLAGALKLPVEELSQGLNGPKWPKQEAA